MDHAVALGMTYQTSYVGLIHLAGLQKGETLLVHAAAGGVGTAAVQLGKALGANVMGTVGSDEKKELALASGCTKVLNYREDGWVHKLQELAPKGVDVVYDPVGGAIFEGTAKHMAF